MLFFFIFTWRTWKSQRNLYCMKKITGMMATCSNLKPLATFGVMTDVQYANCDDRPAGYDSSKIRFYRQALIHVEKAFEYWKAFPRPVSFVLQLGDIIDGLNRLNNGSNIAMEKTLEKFESYHSIPTFHTVGNHELYNFCRQDLAELFNKSVTKMDIPLNIFSSVQQVVDDDHESVTLYYKFTPNEHLKFISLDCFDISVLGYKSSHPHYEEAARILQNYHRHSDFDLWDCDGDLQGLDVRFQQMNGAVGQEQLSWLENELADSDHKHQKVVIFGHVSLSPDSTDSSCLLWNYDEVISCFHKHKCVVAYFSGHSHQKGYAVDSHGIHYIVFSGIIETPPESSAFATVTLYPDRMEIAGHGREQSYNLSIPDSIAKDLTVETDRNIENVASSQSMSVKVEV